MSLRELVEQEIIKGFNRGFNECTPYTNREIPGQVCFMHQWGEYEEKRITDIELFVSSLTDEELLEALRSLHCQMYR